MRAGVRYNTQTVAKYVAATGAMAGAYTVAAPDPGQLKLAFDGTNIWVANNYQNTVTKMKASSGAVVGIYPIQSPNAMVFDGANIWVCGGLAGNTVTKLQASSGSVVGNYTVGTGPNAIAFDGANVWVANYYSGSLSKLLASSGATLATYVLPYPSAYPSALAFDGTNIWVASSQNFLVTKIQASTGNVLGTYAIFQRVLSMAFDGTNIWVANVGPSSYLQGNTQVPIPTVTKLLASTGAIAGQYYSIPVGPDSGMAFDGTNVWVSDYYSVVKISPPAR